MVIINADDYGLNKNVTDAICFCFANGIITTTTMMCNDLPNGCFDYSIKKIVELGHSSDVGIHFVLTEGKPLTQGIKNNKRFCDENGFFRKSNKTINYLSLKDKKDVFLELVAQTERFLSSGLKIHHIDSHHHIHTNLCFISIFLKLMKKYGIKKIRISRNVGKMNLFKKLIKNILNSIVIGKKRRHSILFCSLNETVDFFRNKQTIEIMCHPDIDINGLVIDRVKYDNKIPVGKSIVEKVESIYEN